MRKLNNAIAVYSPNLGETVIINDFLKSIEDDEIKDFISIQNELERISSTVETLQLWVEQMIADKKINIEKYNELKGN